MKSVSVGKLSFEPVSNEVRINGYETEYQIVPDCSIEVKINHSQFIGVEEIAYSKKLEVAPPKELSEELLAVYKKIEEWVINNLK